MPAIVYLADIINARPREQRAPGKAAFTLRAAYGAQCERGLTVVRGNVSHRKRDPTVIFTAATPTDTGLHDVELFTRESFDRKRLCLGTRG